MWTYHCQSSPFKKIENLPCPDFLRNISSGLNFPQIIIIILIVIFKHYITKAYKELIHD